MKVGLLLPHFGAASTHERLFDVGARAGDLGFHSAWVRDQLGFRGMAFEGRQAHFVDPFITLAAIAARNSHMTIGTATLTPIRQPVVTAQLVGSLAYLAKNRLVVGVGLGGQRRAFELAGLRYEDRVAHFTEMVGVLRATASPRASYAGPFTRFDDLTIDPAPPRDLPLWYCGTSPAAIDRALAVGDGWFPGRCPFGVLDVLLPRLREGAAAQGRAMSVGIVPLLSLGRTRDEALEKVNVAALLAEARDKPGWHACFTSADDLRGALIAGTVDDVLSDLLALRDRGVEEVVLDLRQRMDSFEESIRIVAREVLPALAREAPPRGAG